MLEDDLDIMDWLQNNPRALAEGQPRTLIKFISWVNLCVEAGDWTAVDRKEADVPRTFRAHRKKLTALDKGKGRVTAVIKDHSVVGNKRKRTSEEPFTFAEEGSSPLKKRKQQRGETP